MAGCPTKVNPPLLCPSLSFRSVYYIVNLAILQPALAVAMQGALPVGGELAGYARHRAVQTMCLVNIQAKMAGQCCLIRCKLTLVLRYLESNLPTVSTANGQLPAVAIFCRCSFVRVRAPGSLVLCARGVDHEKCCFRNRPLRCRISSL